MNNIQGRVKHTVIEELFKMGSVVHPDVLTTEVTSAMNKWNELVKSNNPVKKRTLLDKILCSKEPKRKQYRIYNKPQDFIRDLKADNINGYPTKDKLYIVDLWHKIQDIRCVLEVKSTCKSCQSNNVFAGKDALLSLQRVLDNKEEYLKL